MGKRPNPPGLQEKIEFIAAELVDMCDAPVTVWIDLMWGPLGQLLLEWFALDVLQILTTYAQPRPPRRGSRGRIHLLNGQKPRGKIKWGKLKEWVFLDYNELIGQILAGGKEEEPWPPGRFRYAMWSIFGLIERALFYWFVMELLTDFAYRWLSLLQESKYCQARDDAVFLGESSGTIALGIFGWTAIGYGAPVKSRNISFYNGFGVGQVVGHGIATFTGEAVAINGDFPGVLGVRMRILTGPGTGKTVQNIMVTSGEGPFGFSLTLDIAPTNTVVVECVADNNAYEFTRERLYVHARAA